MSKNFLYGINTYWVEKSIYPENSAIENHTHDFFHCLCIVQGKGEIVCNDTAYEMSRGKIFIAKPDDMHGFKNLTSEDLIAYEIKFDINADSLKSNLAELPFCLKSDQHLIELFAETYNELKTRNPFSNEIINAVIIQILYSVIRSTYDGFIDSKKLSSIESDNTFAKILIYLDRNISNDISLDQMAQFTHLEKVYFLKKFKKLTELTPMKYLKAIRMKKAKTLLQYSDMSITQVAESVGFKNIQYFSKVFKEYNQINPSSYRSKFVTKR